MTDRATAESPALDAGEWRVAAQTESDDGDAVIRRHDNNEPIGRVKKRYAAQIVADHRSAAAVPKLVAALENIVCKGCDNRVGWNEWPTKYGDWRKCSLCRAAREALAPFNQTGGEHESTN